MQMMLITLSAAQALLYPFHALAYVGPGLGAGTIGVILGIIGSIFVALFAVIWYPFKRLLKKIKKTKKTESPNQ